LNSLPRQNRLRRTHPIPSARRPQVVFRRSAPRSPSSSQVVQLKARELLHPRSRSRPEIYSTPPPSPRSRPEICSTLALNSSLTKICFFLLSSLHLEAWDAASVRTTRIPPLVVSMSTTPSSPFEGSSTSPIPMDNLIDDMDAAAIENEDTFPQEGQEEEAVHEKKSADAPFQRKKQKKTAKCWKEMTTYADIKGVQIAECNYCNEKLRVNKTSTTTQFNRHLNSCLQRKIKLGQNPNLKQQVLAFSQSEEGSSLNNFVYDHARVQELAAHMLLRNVNKRTRPDNIQVGNSSNEVIGRTVVTGKILKKIFILKKLICFKTCSILLLPVPGIPGNEMMSRRIFELEPSFNEYNLIKRVELELELELKCIGNKPNRASHAAR
ncbi:chaperone protein DnaK, partial [Striga asiatica]